MRSVRAAVCAAVCAVLGAAALLVALATPAMAQPTARPTVAGCATGAAHARLAGAAYVRVNQVGYPDAVSKRAYLMSPVAASGAAFTVTDADDATVLSGTVGPV